MISNETRRKHSLFQTEIHKAQQFPFRILLSLLQSFDHIRLPDRESVQHQCGHRSTGVHWRLHMCTHAYGCFCFKEGSTAPQRPEQFSFHLPLADDSTTIAVYKPACPLPQGDRPLYPSHESQALDKDDHETQVQTKTADVCISDDVSGRLQMCASGKVCRDYLDSDLCSPVRAHEVLRK